MRVLVKCTVLIVLLGGCATGPSGFERFYRYTTDPEGQPWVDIWAGQGANLQYLQEGEEPAVVLVPPQRMADHHQELLRRGYCYIGYSNFSGPSYDAEEGAKQQAKRIGASLASVGWEFLETRTSTSHIPFVSPTTTSDSGYVSTGWSSAYYSGSSTTYSTTYVPITSSVDRYLYRANFYVRCTDTEFEHSEFWPNGQIKVRGTLRNTASEPIRIGQWTFWYENGQKKAAEEYRDGVMQGKQIQWYESGQKKQEGEYRDGRLHGKLTTWYENGRKRSEDEWIDDKRHGNHTFWYESGQKKQEVEYRDGNLHGKATLWYEDGQRDRMGEWLNGKQHGKWVYWYENGQTMGEGEFRDGERYGLWTLWYENGQKQEEAEYRDGKIHGTVTEWHENGQKEGMTEYRNGELISFKLWDEDGTLIFSQ